MNRWDNYSELYHSGYKNNSCKPKANSPEEYNIVLEAVEPYIGAWYARFQTKEFGYDNKAQTWTDHDDASNRMVPARKKYIIDHVKQILEKINRERNYGWTDRDMARIAARFDDIYTGETTRYNDVTRIGKAIADRNNAEKYKRSF